MENELPPRPDLEWYRKQAKALVRALGAGEADAAARVESTLGARARERFRLSDAQWVIARELGFPTWGELARRIEARASETRLAGAFAQSGFSAAAMAAAFSATRGSWGERGEAELDSGLRYGGGAPVLVHVGKREGRYSFSDRGAALEAAGSPSGWRETARMLEDEYIVNVSRRGVVFLPAVERSGAAWLASLPGRIAEASVAFYGALLELDE
jgi:hypothetical protein